MIDTVYRYSRELEHSDPNLNLMEKLMRRDLLSWFKKENDGDKGDGQALKLKLQLQNTIQVCYNF